MRSLAELVGQDLVWQVQPGSAGIPDQAQRNWMLFRGDEPVVQIQTIWQRLDHFDVIMESGEGTYQVHMDLAGAGRPSVVWKTGETASAAAFELTSESIITATGWINTASLRKLAWMPTHGMGYEYCMFVPGGPRLITLAAAASMRSWRRWSRWPLRLPTNRSCCSTVPRNQAAPVSSSRATSRTWEGFSKASG